MKTPALVALCLIPLWLSGCTSFSEMHDGQSVNAKVGKDFDVTLKSNPTTGYQWQVVQIDEAMLKQVGTPQYTPNANSGMVGAGGEETFTFRPLKPGKTTLKLAYSRPWEKDKQPGKTYDLTVNVSP